MRRLPRRPGRLPRGPAEATSAAEEPPGLRVGHDGDHRQAAAEAEAAKAAARAFIEEVEAQWAKEEGKRRQRREKKRKEKERKRAGDGRRAGAEAASGLRGTSQDQPPDAGDTADALAFGVMELAGTGDEPAPGSGAAQGACGPAFSGAAELLMAVIGVTESRARELLETFRDCVERGADLHFSHGGAAAELFAAGAG